MSPDCGCKPGRVLQPGFGGKLRSRRQGHASFASVTGTGCCPRPKALRLPASMARFPVARRRHESLARCWSSVDPNFVGMLAHPFSVRSFRTSCEAFRLEPSHRLRDPLARLRTPFEALRPRLHRCLRSTSATRSLSGHPASHRPISARRPRPSDGPVSFWFCSGFPRRRRLLTVVRLSPFGLPEKTGSAIFACG